MLNELVNLAIWVRGMIRKLIYLFVFLITTLSCFAFELDTSVDEEIRRNYNPSALENNLPALPKTSPSQNVRPVNSQTPSVPKTLPVEQQQKTQLRVKNLPNSNYQYDKSTAIKIKKGTKFKVKSNASISDTTRTGARFSFVTLQPVTQRYVTLPSGTVLNAVVTNSHPPQASGNGGLIEVAVDGLKYQGQTYYAQGKVTKANHKKIFVNNIKGKRQYWKNVGNQIDKGKKFYKKTRRTSAKLADNPVGIIISPIPTVVGIGVYAVNLVGSPLFSIGAKGGRVSIPAGSEFEIKLLDDVYLTR